MHSMDVLTVTLSWFDWVVRHAHAPSQGGITVIFGCLGGMEWPVGGWDGMKMVPELSIVTVGKKRARVINHAGCRASRFASHFD